MYSEIASNKRRTIVIMFGFMVFAGLLAWLFGRIYGSPSLTIAVIIGALVYATISYFAGSRLSLAVNGAKEIQRRDNPRLWRVVENLSITDGLPMPRVFIIDDPAPNAFATGRDPNHAAVCATSGLLEIMDDKELEGVIAHELGHVKNYDIRVAMISFALSAVVSIIADVMLRMTLFRGNNREEGENNQLFLVLGIIAAILAPIIATLIQLAISRKREFLADATGALTTRYPEGLASALEKIERTGSVLRHQNTATAHFFFANPLRGHSVTNFFSTHPPIKERIRRLRSMDLHV
ncbi:MAG TPA: M48 family metalloprotease [Candidatus Saccharimonadales bacterium]|nr:M48 family metalloprotease [Candidatus Saccharimonadales bacterium]